jgi:hypothetical protein
MIKDRVNNDFVSEAEGAEPDNGKILKGLIDGTLLTRGYVTRQMPFFLFIAFLGLVYIGNRYHAEKTRTKIAKLKIELMELRSEALYTSSELMKMGRQTEVAREIKERGLSLKESLVPPKKIKSR